LEYSDLALQAPPLALIRKLQHEDDAQFLAEKAGTLGAACAPAFLIAYLPVRRSAYWLLPVQ